MSTLGFHLDGRICRVGCSFCYLGARRSVPAETPDLAQTGERTLAPELLGDIVREMVAGTGFGDIAVAVSEPAGRWRAGLSALAQAARAHGVALAITTTPDVVANDPWVLDGASRVSLSIDPEKGRPEKGRPEKGRPEKGLAGGEVAADVLASALAACELPGLEVVALVSLSSPAFAAELERGLLERLLAEPRLDLVALNGIKPPPPWCDRAFWLRFCARIAPLLDRHLHRRLHLDCYVGARIVGLGGCPAKPDVSPGREFRACVYQAAPDFVFADAADLARRTADYLPPAACPFEIR